MKAYFNYSVYFLLLVACFLLGISKSSQPASDEAVVLTLQAPTVLVLPNLENVPAMDVESEQYVPHRQARLNRLFRALASVESGGNTLAYNDGEHAAGIIQIRPIMLEDVNRILGAEYFTLQDRFDASQSRRILEVYLDHYSPDGSDEQWARKWNGGPRGDTKTATEPYWQKVRAALSQL